MIEASMDLIRTYIQQWLAEDIGHGDVTTMSTIPAGIKSKAIIHAKETGVLAGIPVARLVFETIDPDVSFQALKQDGDTIRRGDIIAELSGQTRSILIGERLALNLLQRLSGVASITREYVNEVDGYPVRIVDTRKTTPGHRLLEKYAVRIGGGHNHRFGLYDAVMIKDNHIKGAGGITNAVTQARNAIPHTMKIEVEVENEHQLEEALQAGADIIMLDNMEPVRMKEVVERIRKAAPHVVIEASGGIRLDTVREVAACGVDVISAGSLTHSIRAVDISLDLGERKEVRP